MANHTSAREREETPHVTKASRTIISEALKRRAQSVINNKSIDSGTRAIIRYGLEINDPWLPQLVRRVDAGETIIDNLNFSETPPTNDDSSEEKIEAFLPVLDPMIGGGLLTLEKVKVIDYRGEEPAE